MYSKETIAKTIRAMKDALNYYNSIPVHELHVSISVNNDKTNEPSVSTLPGITCGNCKECLPYCYAIRMIYKYGYNYENNAQLQSWAKNTSIMQRDLDYFFAEVDAWLTENEIVFDAFRFHVSGEIVSEEYFAHMVQIAKNHPTVFFWTYSKMFDVVNGYCDKNGGKENAIPDNFVIMFSAWIGLDMENPYHFPEFIFVPRAEKEEFADAGFHCPGKCRICKRLHRGCFAGETTYSDEH